MSLTLIGQKKGMAQVFDQDGKLVVCTVILAEPNTVLQIKRKETHGYNGIQLGGVPMTKSQADSSKKAYKRPFCKSSSRALRVIHESRLDEVDQYQVGQKIDASRFCRCEICRYRRG